MTAAVRFSSTHNTQMPLTSAKAVSPTRQYVAVCHKTNWNGHYFRRFVLPAVDPDVPTVPLNNDAEKAEWFFLNRIDHMSCVSGIVTFEDYSNIAAVDVVKGTKVEVKLVQTLKPEEAAVPQQATD